jgi:sulfite exporter TauE/SafE
MNYRAISGMTTGAVMVTIGAILYFAVTAEVEGFDVDAAGAILMIVGFTVAFGALLWGVFEGVSARSRVGETRRVAPTPPPAQPVETERPQTVVVETRTDDEHRIV